jgi:hypothetical protein
VLEVGERVRLLSVVTIVVHEICTINGLSIANEDCVVQLRKYEFGSAILIYSHAGLRSGGRQAAEEI